MKLKLLKFLWWLAIWSRWYKFWSTVYRWLYQRDLKNAPLPTHTIETIIHPILQLPYKADGFKELWDVCSLPQQVEYYLKTRDLNGPMDCDEYAVYAANTIQCLDSKLLLVSYIREDGSIGGHMVARILTKDGIYHVSNWGVHGPFTTNRSLISSILGAKTLIGYACYNPRTLGLLYFSTKAPTL